MSLTFPTTLPSPVYPIGIDTEDPALRSPFENGSVQTRPKFTTQRRTWNLNWTALSTTNRNTLNAFFLSTMGGSESFTWTTDDDESVTVRFTSYSESKITPDLYAVTVQLAEV